MNRPLDLASLAAGYEAGVSPEDVVRDVYAAIRAKGERPVWISLVPEERALARAADLKRRRAASEKLPLYGVPFAAKDNIDVAGVTTTAACPDFAYVPERSATIIERLEAAGAIVIGKTNLDQFATGLNGTRSPYGMPSSVFDARYVSGGSSSGSAVSVASGLVSFSLGTDTAGSGRVPAAFNNLVGLKPTKGLFSTRGVVPACRSLDCVSIFAGTVSDALAVAEIAAAHDPEDGFSRKAPDNALTPAEWPKGFRFGIPCTPEFFGDEDAAALYAAAITRLETMGGIKVEFDYTPFRDAAQLLYAGPWVAERLAAIKEFAREKPDSIHPVVRGIVEGGAHFSAVDAFEGQYRLADLIQTAEAEWTHFDVMLLPTAPTIYTIEDMLADPVRLNSNLGTYTNFVNLMDLSAIAVPAGFRADGMPFGVTFVGRAFRDGAIAALADRLHRTLDGATLGGTGRPLPDSQIATTQRPAGIEIAVIGAHLEGLPLHWQLADRGARFVRATKTAPGYSLYALSGTNPPKPGLVFDGTGRGDIEIEIWQLDAASFGSFVSEIPPPLGIGTLRLADGSAVKGFLCESHALAGARDITGHGGWRAFLAAEKATA